MQGGTGIVWLSGCHNTGTSFSACVSCKQCKECVVCAQRKALDARCDVIIQREARDARRDAIERVGTKSPLGAFLSNLTATLAPSLLPPSTLAALVQLGCPLPEQSQGAAGVRVYECVCVCEGLEVK
eukprot:1156532-Pelagomonas_calceolata.AAC.1